MQAFHNPIRAIAVTSILLLAACNDDASSSRGGDPSPDGGGSTPPTAADAITESVLAACPESTSLIESTEWPSCLAGRRVTGKEPFNDSVCELTIGEAGAFEYWRGGALALSVPSESAWGAASGSYQNQLNAGRRAFLASVAPGLPAVEGEVRVERITLNFFSLADDKVEIQFMDEDLARKTYTCQVDVI